MNNSKVDIKTYNLVKNKLVNFTTFSSKDFFDITNDTRQLFFIFKKLERDKLIKKIARGIYTKYSNNIIKLDNENKYSILYGVELEMEYNRDLINIETSGYHSNDSIKFNDDFVAETDGSLRALHFINGGTCELVSKPMTKDDLMKSLKRLKNKLTKNKKDVELSDVINFNTSTGAHIHLSLLVKNGKNTIIPFRDNEINLIGQTKNVKHFCSVLFMKKIAKMVKLRIKDELPQFYDSFIKYYFRHYAKRMNKRTSVYSKYHEFNLSNSDTLEYRSLHLRGIKNWNELFKFYDIVTSVIDEQFNKELKKAKSFNRNIDFDVDCYEDDDVVNDVDEISVITSNNNYEEVI